MSVALILLSLAALCAATFGWLWLCAGFRQDGLRGALGLAALQVSGLCLVYGLLRGQPLVGIYTAVLPPLALAELVTLARFESLLASLAWAAAPFAAAVLLAGLALRRTRVWAPGLAGVTGLIAVMLLGDQIGQKAMCEAAAKHGIDGFQRNGFVWSLTIEPGSRGVVHGLADVDDRRLGWSYRQMDWYDLPKDAVVIAPETREDCVD